MKFIIYAMGIAISILMGISILSSCKSTKTDLKKDLTMTLLLAEGKTQKYISKNYAEFTPSQLSKSNRTLNQYRVKFNCTEKEKAKLLLQLKNDSMILKSTIASPSGVTIQSGTNEKSGKANPKAKQ